ncbi:GyrI-like domain-containing protein [Geodermatophilus sp. SYSU D01119]
MRVDLRRELDCYRAGRRPRVVEVPDLRYLAVDGHGDPNTEAWQAALRALYPVAYTLRALARRELGRDHVVPPLEATWSAADMDAFTVARDKARWDWTAMIAVPDRVPDALVGDAVAAVAAKGAPERLADVRLQALSEGTCVQALHVGSYDDEGPLLEEMHNRFIPEHGFTMRLRHHEIYLSDARRTAPARLRTILRQPVGAAR